MKEAPSSGENVNLLSLSLLPAISLIEPRRVHSWYDKREGKKKIKRRNVDIRNPFISA